MQMHYDGGSYLEMEMQTSFMAFATPRDSLLEAESTLTDRYQTTVPEVVRSVLRLDRRDKIHYELRPNGDVVLTRVERAQEEDPALIPFLALLERDIESHPERLMPLTQSFADELLTLTQDVEVDLDAPISDDD